jgi:sulfite reductase (ferredoxin)
VTLISETQTAATRTPRPRPKRGEGQWALGYREPLNKNEQTKKDDDALNVRARIVNIYAHRGFDSIDPADLRGRFRWMGLYTQRAPGFDGGKTAALEEEELDDRYFMMRVRTDGQILGPAQLRALGETSTQYARNTADITDRNNIQYHWIEVESVPLNLGAARRRRSHHPRSVRRQPAPVPGLTRRRDRQGRDHRRLRGTG